MNTETYLNEVLQLQNLADDSQELKDLQEHRADVERLLRAELKGASPTIRFGGSRAKGTMNKEEYDLDIICYVPHDNDAAGASLEEIYNNTYEALNKEYFVSRKNSALRLQSKDPKALARDFHIDVVPGRYSDDAKADCFIYQSNAEKKRLKTNLDVHIAHVRDSGVVPAIRLLKLWKTRKSLPVKQFVWELLIIDLLKGKKSQTLTKQLEHVWTEIRNSKEPMKVEDPANPTGNDLSKLLDAGMWQMLSGAADATLRTIQNVGWEAVFGTTKRLEGGERLAAVTQAIGAASIRTKPWSGI
jgi:hypothetical protein